MSPPEDVVRLIPTLFHRLKAVGDGLHGEHRFTTSMRGAIEPKECLE